MLLGDFGQIAAQALPIVAEKQTSPSSPPGMAERFMARARSEGVPFAPPSTLARRWTQRARGHLVWAALAASGALLCFTLGMATERLSGSPPSPHEATTASYYQNNSNERLLAENTELKRQIEFQQSERKTLVVRLATTEQNLEALGREKAELGTRLTESEAQTSELQKRDAARELDIAQLKGELSKLRSEKESDRIAEMAEVNELNGLREKVAKQAADLSQRRQLTYAANQARDLIVARNLHIVDVHDTDENGRGQRAFGRIFYTEGKSLVFYAYDLADSRKLNAKISFYVWGENEGTSLPVKNLGIFHSDDPNDSRWILTFDDSRVLSQINSVFVTIENKKTVTEPSGKKILYAFLGNKPNHP